MEEARKYAESAQSEVQAKAQELMGQMGELLEKARQLTNGTSF